MFDSSTTFLNPLVGTNSLYGKRTVCFFFSRLKPYGRVRLARFALKTLTPRLTDFFTDFEKKTDTFASTLGIEAILAMSLMSLTQVVPFQVCARHKSCEAAIHALRSIFDVDETDAVLLIDTSNAFNALNRAAAPQNIRVLCPTLDTCVINTYRQPAHPFITGGKELISAEGTTQSNPLYVSLYALSLQPLITRLHVSSAAKQCWFADDATGSGFPQDEEMVG